MENINVTGNNFLDMRSLVKITNLIYKKYVEIYELDLEGKVENQEYESKVNELKRLLALEEVFYKSLDLQFLAESMTKHVDMFTEDKLASELIDVYESKKDRLIQRRIFKKVVEKPSVERNPHGRLTGREIANNALKQDFINTLLAIITQYINDEHFKDVREYFVNLKYNLSFIYGSIERDFLENKFKVNPTPIWTHESIARENGINENDLINMNLTETFNVINYFISVINNLYNYDLNDPVTITTGVSAGAFLRTAILFTHESLRNEFTRMFGGENYEHLELWEATDPSEMLGISFSRYDIDKNLPIKIDLNLG